MAIAAEDDVCGPLSDLVTAVLAWAMKWHAVRSSHAEGDDVLDEVAGTIRQVIRL